MKIGFFDAKKYDIESFNKYKKDMEIIYYETKLNIKTVDLCQGLDGVCVFVNDIINKEVIDKLYQYKVKFIALRSAGYNNVDIKYCFGKIHVFHVPSYSPYSIAEHAMALLLTMVRKTHKAYIRTKDFNFSLDGLTGFDLKDKTIGIIGTGKIGAAFIDICKGFKMQVIAYDKYPSLNDVNYQSLEDVFKNSDIISLHCPLNSETRHMINKETLNLFKKGIIIINTSRGALIDTATLIEGLKEGIIKAACLDVYEEEADIFFTDHSSEIMSDDNLSILINMPNVILTSHQAFLTVEALEKIAEETIHNILEFKELGYSQNELCYYCDKIETCKKHRIAKCF